MASGAENTTAVTEMLTGARTTTSTVRPTSTTSSILSISDRMDLDDGDDDMSLRSTNLNNRSSSCSSSTMNRNSKDIASTTPIARTTTISTIAMESHSTPAGSGITSKCSPCRLVIALLQTPHQALQLKIIDLSPNLLKLPDNLKDAEEYLTSHNQVIKNLQSKQSPVEELLRQADNLISTQKPRAEVYAAMADSLGQTWKDLNTLLEERKTVIHLAVIVHTNIAICTEKINQVHNEYSKISYIPTEDFISSATVQERLKKLKNDRLEILKLVSICLESSDKLLNKIADFNYSIDSRDLFLLRDVEIANKQVHRWLERLHDRRMILEDKLKTKREQFEEYLDYIEYDIEIQKLDEKLENLRGFDKNFDFGNSVESCQKKMELLQLAIKDMKGLQEKSILTAKALDDSQQNQRSKFYQRSTLKATLYKILGEVNDLLTEFTDLELGLSKCEEFFHSAEETLAKLDELSAKDSMALPKSQLDLMMQDPLSKGHAILDAHGWDAIKTNGVRAVHDNLLRRKMDMIDEIDHLQILDEYNHFLEYVNQSYHNLLNVESTTVRQAFTVPVDSLQVASFKQRHEQTLEELSHKLNFDDLITKLETIYPNLSEEEKLETEEKINQLKFLSNLIVELIIQRIFVGGEWLRILESYEKLQTELLDSGCGTPQTNFVSKEKLENVLDQVIGIYGAIQEQLDEVHRSDPDLNTAKMELKIEEIIKELQLKLEALAVNERSRSICQIYKVKLDRHLLGYLDDGVFVSSSYFPVLNEQDAAFSPSSATSSVLSTNSTSGPALNIIRDRVQDKLDSVLDRFLDPLIREFRQDISKLQLNPSLTVVTPTKEEEDLIKYFNRLKESYVSVSKDILGYLRELHLVNQEIDEKFSSVNASTVEQAELCLNQLSTSYNEINKKISEGLNKRLDHLLELIVREEPPAAADKETKILKAMTTKITKEKLQNEFLNKQDQLTEQLTEKMVDADLDLISKQLNDLIDELEQPCSYGDCLSDAQAYLANFARFEKTVEILKEKLNRLVSNASLADNEKAKNLTRKLNELLDKKVKRRELILLSLEYFRLIQVSKEHYTRVNGSLQTITEKSNALTITKEQIENLLKEVEGIKSKEQEQEERLVEIERISSVLFGPMESYLGKTQHEPLKRENNSMAREIHHIETNLNDLLNSFKRRSKSTETQTSQVPTPAPSPIPSLQPINESMKTHVVTQTSSTTLSSTGILRVQSPLPLSGSPLPPLVHKLEKETQIELEEEPKLENKVDRDTITQTMDERIISAETQTEQLQVSSTSTETTETEIFRVPSASPLEEYSAPNFIQTLKDVVVNEGDRVVLECRTAGDVKRLDWLKDGMNISSNPDYKTDFKDNTVARLTIDEVFYEDSSIFTCRAMGGADNSVVETSGKLTVREPSTSSLQPPKFLPHPNKSVGVHGNPHSLQLRIDGNPLPTVQWFKNDTCIDTSPDYIITFNNGLCEVQFDELLKDMDDGVYTCVGVNKMGKCSTKIEVEVKAQDIVSKRSPSDPPILIRPLPKNVMTRAGQKLKLECEFESASECNVMWVKDDLKILTKNNSSAEIRTSGGRLATVIYNEAYPLNSGKYTVLIRNAGGEVKSDSQVVVKGLLPAETSDSELNTSDLEIVKPVIKMPLKDAESVVGDSLRLDCVIVGHPEPEVIWYKNSTPLKESPNHHLLFHGDKCSLIIHRVDLNDQGMYSVSAINNGGEATSKCQVLIYEKEPDEKEPEKPKVDPPKFVQLIHDQMVTAGEMVQFTCEFSSGKEKEVEPEITWWKNNQRLETSQDIKITQQQSLYSLSILEVQPHHRGNYMVKAKNEGGESKCFACLIVKENLEQQQKQMPVVEQKPAKLIETKESPPSLQRKLSLPKAGPRAPRFTKMLEGRMVDEGNTNVSLKCIVDANPPAEIKWTRNNSTEALVSSATSNFEINYNEKTGEIELVVKSVSISNGGRYNCTATNETGMASSVADLVVKKSTFPPVISQRLQSLTIDEGKRICLEIDVFAKPTPKVTWELNGLELKPGADPTIVLSSDSPTRFSLCVNEAIPGKHRGQYKVTAKNESGEASSTCTVNIMERPGSRFDDFSVSSVPSPIPIPIPIQQTQETITSSVTHFPVERIIIPPPRLSISNQGQPEQIIVHRKEEETKTIIQSTTSTTITSSQHQQHFENSTKSTTPLPERIATVSDEMSKVVEGFGLVPGPDPEILVSPSPTSWTEGIRNQVQEKAKAYQEQRTDTAVPPGVTVRIIPIVEHKQSIETTFSQLHQPSPQKYEPSPQKYEPPKQNYELPQPKYEPPQPKYEPPQPKYEPPQPKYEPPQPKYDPPQPKYEPPQPKYEPPQPKYELPPQKYEPRPIQLPLSSPEESEPEKAKFAVVPKPEELKPAQLPVFGQDDLKFIGIVPLTTQSMPVNSKPYLRESFLTQEFSQSSSSLEKHDLPWASDPRDLKMMKPMKFVPEKLRESDYESDFESSVILPKWVPQGSSQTNSPAPMTSAFVSVTSTPSAVLKTFPTITSTVSSMEDKSYQEKARQKPIVPPKPKQPPSPVPHPTLDISIPQPTASTSSYSVRGLAKSWPPVESDQQILSQTSNQQTVTSVMESKTITEREPPPQYLTMPPSQAGSTHHLSPMHMQVPDRSRSPTPNKEALEMDKLWSRPIRFSSPCTVTSPARVRSPSPQPLQQQKIFPAVAYPPSFTPSPVPPPVLAPKPAVPVPAPVQKQPSPVQKQPSPIPYSHTPPNSAPASILQIIKSAPSVITKPVSAPWTSPKPPGATQSQSQPVNVPIVQTVTPVSSPLPPKISPQPQHQQKETRYYVSVVSTPRTTPVPGQMMSPTPGEMSSDETGSFHDKREFFEQTSSSFSSSKEEYSSSVVQQQMSSTSSNSKNIYQQSSIGGGTFPRTKNVGPQFHALFDESLLPPPGEPPVFLYAPPPSKPTAAPPATTSVAVHKSTPFQTPGKLPSTTATQVVQSGGGSVSSKSVSHQQMTSSTSVITSSSTSSSSSSMKQVSQSSSWSRQPR